MTAKSETRDFLWFLVKLGLFVFILRSFIVSPFNIPSESMQPRLLIGDYLLVAKWPYGYSRYSLPFSVPLIPEGHLFMMGDNRDRSADSRFPAVEGGGIGLVPEKNLVGKALVSVFSTDGSANWLLPWTWFTAARWSRIGEGF